MYSARPSKIQLKEYSNSSVGACNYTDCDCPVLSSRCTHNAGIACLSSSDIKQIPIKNSQYIAKNSTYMTFASAKESYRVSKRTR